MPNPQAGRAVEPGVAPVVAAPVQETPEPEPQPELFEFYSPYHPNEKIIIGDRTLPVQFNKGRFSTNDPNVAQQLRAANRYGLYLEADLNKAVVCAKCGWPSRSAKAIELHYLGHME